MRKKLIEFLNTWSTVNDRSKNLPAPELVVKTWVKIHCKHVKDMNEIERDENDHPTLYCLLSPTILSDRNMWTILEQELTAYKRMSSDSEYQTICHKMERRIKGILLQLFTNPDRIEKEKTLTVQHIQDSAIECLSKAIQIMEEVSNVMQMPTEKNPFVHQLYVARCLRELCTRGDDSYLETTSREVNVTDCTMYLLDNIFDFLQLKGFMESSNAAYCQLIRMHKLKSFSVDKQLTLLWETRRLSHVFCVSPMNAEFIQKLSDCSIDIKEIESCIRKLIGFKHHFFFLFSDNSDEHDVPKDAHEPISTDLGRSYSTFVDGYRCLDLCQKLIANGQLIEAISSAKEAQRLHGELFHTKFAQNVEKLNDEHNLMVDFSKNLLEMNISIARDIFLFDSLSRDSNEIYISPWKIMQCYLESTLQVAIIHEMMGEGTEAVAHLLKGESISISLNLPFFLTAFSSLLGKIYAQQGKWDLAKKRLMRVEKILNRKPFCCSLCKALLQATLSEYYGDLWEMKSENTSKEEAVKCYQDALNELDNSKWETPLSCPKDATKDPICNCFKEDKNVMNKVEAETKGKGKRVRESRYNTRSTRPKPHSSQNESMKSKVTGSLAGNQVSGPYDILTQKESYLDQTCVFSKMRCWHSHSSEVVKSWSLDDFIALKWEFVRRKLSMKLLGRLVKCFGNPDQMDEAHKSLRRSISVLVARNPFHQTFSSIPLHHFHHLVVKEIPEDMFAIERAELFHDICWFSLKCYHSTSNIFCDPSSIKFECLASWLMQAFVLSREVPVVLQKVSKLLAVMYVVSATRKQYSLSSDSKALGENYWSSYFHQASIGTHLTCQFLSHLSRRCKGPNDSRSSRIQLLRLPKDIKGLEEHVKIVLDDLPSTTIIGISLLDDDYNSLLQELLSCGSVAEAWMLVSRLSSKMEPVVMLLPLDSILQDEGDMTTFSDTYDKCKEIIGDQRCPWRFTVVDHIAPAFETIFKRNYLSSSAVMQNMLKVTGQNPQLWHNLRDNLEGHLKNFLRNLEDRWLGSWKWLLLGEWVNCKNFDSVLNNLISTLKLDVNEDLLKIILGASKYYEKETLFSDLCVNKDCYIAKVGHCDKGMSGIFLKAANESREPSEVEVGQLNEALNMLEVEGSVKREPIILVLDYEVAMLPWESLPILRNQEVYRMPSLSSILAVLDKGINHKKQVRRNLVPFSTIDPQDAYYLINPDTSLPTVQLGLWPYFKDKNLEGVAGSAPTTKELAAALGSHDLFLYDGHGSGERYISRSKILKLKKCAAAVLMGCRSGSLTLQGIYAPNGIHMSYLMAGSPVIVGHLWDMLSTELILFCKAMFDEMLDERSKECSQCDLEEYGPNNNCCQRHTIGAIMGHAREVSSPRYPYLTGASIVCHGVPTRIRKKKNI